MQQFVSTGDAHGRAVARPTGAIGRLELVDPHAQPRRLLVAGWSADAGALVEALDIAGSHRAVAIGDHSALHLTRARSDTGLPCYQHLHEMTARVEHDALLVAGPGLISEVAVAAAEAGATLILDAGALPAEDLASAARATLHAGTVVYALRPRLRMAGLENLVTLAADRPEWQPGFLDLTVEARDTSPLRLLDDAVAMLVSLIDEAPERVTASAYGDTSAVGAIVAELRYPNGGLASLRARTGLFDRIVASAETPAGAIDLRAEAGEGLLALCTSDDPPEVCRFDVDPGEAFTREVARVASAPVQPGGDAAALLREASIRGAIEDAMGGGHAAARPAPAAPAGLRLVPGGASPSTPRRRGHLRLVTA